MLALNFRAMGNIFAKKEKSRITEQDHAVLGLKKQRDQLKQYQKRINNDLEKEKELAKKLLKEGKKDRAKLLLRKKKFQEGLLEKTDAQLDQLERLVHDIEFATIQKQVLDGLKSGNEALEKANTMFSLDEIEDIMADTQEAVEKQREIDSLLSGQLTEVRINICYLLPSRHESTPPDSCAIVDLNHVTIIALLIFAGG